MRMIAMACVGVLLCAAGCNVQTGISTVEPTITKSSKRDFNFVGTWIALPSEEFDRNVDSYEMTIEQGDSYTATLVDSSDGRVDKLEAQFRTHEVAKGQPNAIIEIEIKFGEDLAYRRLAIAETKGEHLYLWMIDGRKIGKHLFDDGIPAVLEHFSFSTTVRCDHKKLLRSLSEHSRDVVGSAQVFKRKPKDGR